ncbi:MAG: sigma-54 dependent transcriptional regulator [Syntrophaceae bacterium]|nr:sigma-54 dependent transcriptional regulator [Syntrophaceae bacterium]
MTPSRNRSGSARTALVIAQDRLVFETVSNSFKGKRAVDETYSIDIALELLRARHYDFLFIDLEILRGRTGGNGYKTALQPFWLAAPDLEIIVMSPPEQIREAVMAVKAGASNYLTYPLDPDEVKYVADSIYESIVMQSEFAYLRDKFWESDSLEIVQTRSPAMKQVFEKVRLVASTNSTVLISGDTGTGKSVLAKLIHRHSNRKNGPFISLHCGAIPETLLESELFGHEKGSFTGAVRRQLGKFEIAKGGTLFLDEIGTITPSAQIKLLQILQEGTFQRIGGEEVINADVRVIAATNTDLKKMIDSGAFRRDLYYRLNVFPIEIPALSERREDIRLFVEIFLKRLNQFSNKEIRDIHPDVLQAFMKYPWPGNIRELQNLIERAHIIEQSSVLTPESFPGELFENEPGTGGIRIDPSLSLKEIRQAGVEQVERLYLKEILAEERGNIGSSARRAGITTRQFSKLMNRYSLHKEDFKTPKGMSRQ